MMFSFPFQMVSPIDFVSIRVAPQKHDELIKEEKDVNVRTPPPTKAVATMSTPTFRSIPPPTETPRALLTVEPRIQAPSVPDEFQGINIVTADVVVAEVVNFCDFGNYFGDLTVATPSFKLPSSKSPIMEAMVYCAIHKWGIELEHHDKATQQIVFKVLDFEHYYRLSCVICSKQTPSEDIRSRMKALQRWFTSFPSRKDLAQTFSLTVKVRQFRKVHDIIEKVKRFVQEFSPDR
jgi:hypothetical protein